MFIYCRISFEDNTKQFTSLHKLPLYSNILKVQRPKIEAGPAVACQVTDILLLNYRPNDSAYLIFLSLQLNHSTSPPLCEDFN